MIKKDRISVIVPAYNSAKHIDKCLLSLTTQLYQDLEIILVVDTASQDKTLHMAKVWANNHENIRVIEAPKLRNATKSRNLGISSATGEYIGFVDADDYSEKSMYTKMFAKMQEHNVDVVECNYYHSYKNYEDIADNKTISGLLSKNDIILRSLKGTLWKYLIKKDVFKKVQLDEKLTLGEDCDFSMGLGLAGISVYYISNPLYHYSQNTGSMSKTYTLANAKSILPYVSKTLSNLEKITDNNIKDKIFKGMLHSVIYWFNKISNFNDSFLFYKMASDEFSKIKPKSIKLNNKDIKILRYFFRKDRTGFLLLTTATRKMFSFRIMPKKGTFRIILFWIVILDK